MRSAAVVGSAVGSGSHAPQAAAQAERAPPLQRLAGLSAIHAQSLDSTPFERNVGESQQRHVAGHASSASPTQRTGRRAATQAQSV